MVHLTSSSWRGFSLVVLLAGAGGCEGLAAAFFMVDNPPTTDIPVYTDALDRVLAYVNDSIHDIFKTSSLNVLLGLFLSEVHLTSTLLEARQKHLSNVTRAGLASTLAACQSLRRRVLRHAALNKISRLLRDIEPWLQDQQTIRRGQLTRWLPPAGETSAHPLLGFNDIIMDWDTFMAIIESPTLTPNETQSDKCLLELSDERRRRSACATSAPCRAALFAGLAAGYPLAHRYLFLLLSSTAKRCYHTSPVSDEIRMDVSCAMLFLEAAYIAKNDFRHPDLFMEIVGLCSLRGYQEFGQARWFHRMLSWQLPQGCFPALVNALECDHHATAVGMLNLAFAIRYAMQLVRY